MHPYQLSVFCKVVEYASFSRAAEELYITQPAVSQQVKSLERELGVQVLERKGRDVLLTDAGQIVYRLAQQIISTEAEMRRLLDALKVGTRGQVPVGVSSTGVLYYMPPLLRRFRAAHPDVDISLTSDITDRVRTAVVEGHQDVGLVWGPVTDRRLQARLLYQAPFVIICSPDHPLASRDGVEPADLSEHRFIMNLPGTTSRQYVEGILRGLGVTVQVAMEGSSTENIKKVVESGLGLALVARRAIQHEVRGRTLCIVPVRGLEVLRDISLISPAHREISAAAQRFIDFVLKVGPLFAAQDEIVM